jgi:hypothetical protein
MNISKIAEVNARIVVANNPALVKTAEIPINNIVYHLYNNGRVTTQKGGWAYGCLGETTNYKFQIIISAKIHFRFPNISEDGTSYAILTQEQCIDFYKEIKDCINYRVITR